MSRRTAKATTTTVSTPRTHLWPLGTCSRTPTSAPTKVPAASRKPVAQDFVHCELWPRLVGELAFHDRANEAPVLRHDEAPVGRLSQGPHGLEALCDDSDDRGVGDLLAGGP